MFEPALSVGRIWAAANCRNATASVTRCWASKISEFWTPASRNALQIDRREVRLQKLLQNRVVGRSRQHAGPKHEAQEAMSHTYRSPRPRLQGVHSVITARTLGKARSVVRFRRGPYFGVRACNSVFLSNYFGIRICVGGCSNSSGTGRARVSAGGVPKATYNWTSA